MSHNQTSKGETPKLHSEFCDGHVACPVTKAEECGTEMIWNQDRCVSVYCNGCHKIHNIKES